MHLLHVLLLQLPLLLFMQNLAVPLDFAPLISRQLGGEVFNGNVSGLDQSLLFHGVQPVFVQRLPLRWVFKHSI